MCGDQAAKMFELIPSSAETVKRRFDDMAVDWKEQLLNEIRASYNFSIQLDESTTISSEALLFVYVRYNANKQLKNDLLYSINLPGTTKGEDNFEVADSFFKSHHLNYERLVA